MHRLREVRVEDAADQVAQQAGLLLEQAVGFVVEAPLGMCTAELADGYVTRAVRVNCSASRTVQIPSVCSRQKG